jgi:hypothetical protein
MTAWAVRGVELPFGEEIASWLIDAAGSIHDRPVAGADLLPGGFIVPGLVDAHATSGPGMPVLQAAGRYLAPAGRYFPDLAAGTDAEATYRIDSIAQLVAAAHEAGARVAVHSTVRDAGRVVAAVPRRRSCRRHRHLSSRPREDPGQLAHPAAVVAGGTRLR